MSIRTFLQRRASLVAGILILAFLSWLVAAIRYRFLFDEPLFFLGFVALCYGIAAGVVFRCPQCTRNLSPLLPYFGPFRWMSKRTVVFCPFCGVAVDGCVDEASGA
jgi:hypothetical protein